MSAPPSGPAPPRSAATRRAPAARRNVRSRLRAAALAWILERLASLFGRRDWATAQRWGARLGAAAWRLSRRDRRRAIDHIGIAFPELATAEREALARRSFLHLGTTLGEALYLMRHDAAELARRVRVEGWDNVAKARAAGPVLIVTGHCGNWEMLAATINGHGLRMSVVARQLDEPELDSLLVGLRARFGTPTIARGTPGAARALLRALREGGALGMLIDQDTKVEGVWVPFLGRPAFTPVGAAELARRFRCAVIPASIERLRGRLSPRALPAAPRPARRSHGGHRGDDPADRSADPPRPRAVGLAPPPLAPPTAGVRPTRSGPSSGR